MQTFAHALLRRTIAALELNPELECRYRRPCAARLAHLIRNPGDIAPDDTAYLVGMAIAMHEVPPSPGWIPECQKRAYEYSKIAERFL